MNDAVPTRIEWTSRRTADGLRTRYRPACRINHAFFTVAPWLDVLLLGVCFTLALGARTLIPGVRVDLPSAPFREGLQSDLILVVNPLPRTPAGNPAANAQPAGTDGSQPMGTLVFFNDDRFNLSSERQRTRLQTAIAGHMERVGGRDALLYVDRRVRHGDVVEIVTLLRETGVRHANLAVKSP